MKASRLAWLRRVFGNVGGAWKTYLKNILQKLGSLYFAAITMAGTPTRSVEFVKILTARPIAQVFMIMTSKLMSDMSTVAALMPWNNLITKSCVWSMRSHEL